MIGNRVAIQPFFHKGTLSLLTAPVHNPEKPVDYSNWPSCKESRRQTGQSFSDYEFRDGTLHRYYDLKSGNIDPFKEHIFVTSDINKYHEVSESLSKSQMQVFKSKGPSFEKFYNNNRDLLPNEINPSLIFHINNDYIFSDSHIKPGVVNHLLVNTSSCSNIENTENTMTTNLINQGKMVTLNYYNSPYASSTIKDNIKAQLIAETIDWLSPITNTLL